MNEPANNDSLKFLKIAERSERRRGIGRLKIFIGMAAGVGKTFAMLEEAQQLLHQGVDILVATVNTHGRIETEKLLSGLKALPLKEIPYKGIICPEMDLDGVIQSRPQLVLVDELAHSNVPGSQHAKRWQDVIEILHEGIDVFTTINIQHFESHKEIVQEISGIVVRETVPDHVLDYASEIELIDIPPEELLKRLKEGKVYIEESSRIALDHFFKYETLSMLRELSLRLTAAKVGRDITLSSPKSMQLVSEKIILAISPSPYSEQLIRATRKKAYELQAEWIAVYVDTGKKLSNEDKARLQQNITLARQLGAEVIITQDTYIKEGISRITKQHMGTKIIVGRSSHTSMWRQIFRSELYVDLEQMNKDVDITILRQEKPLEEFKEASNRVESSASRGPASYESMIALLFLILMILGGAVVDSLIGYKEVGFFFWASIFALSCLVSLGPVLLVSLTSMIAWDLLFIPPPYEFKLGDTQDISMMLMYIITAVIVGTLTTRLKKQELFLKQRAEKSEHLYQIEKAVMRSTTYEMLSERIKAILSPLFPGEIELIRAENRSPMNQNEKEEGVINWVIKHKRSAGRGTDVLPSSEKLYIPISFGDSVIAVFAYKPKPSYVTLEEIDFIETICQIIGIKLAKLTNDSRTT